MNTEQRSSAIVSSSTCGHLLCQNQACFQQELAQRSIPITKGGNQIPPLPPCCRCLEQVYKRCALEVADAACSPSRAEQASQLRAGGSSCSHSPARTRLGELSARSSAKASAGDRAAREGHSLVSSTSRAELKLPKHPPWLDFSSP